MTILSLFLFLAATKVDLDILSVPLYNEIKVVLTSSTPMGARSEIKRDGTVTRIKIEIDRIAPPSTLGPALNTYVVWAISPEGILDNLGELEIKGAKAQFQATTRFTQFGIFITAEPHYLVDRPSSAIAYRSQAPETDFRRKAIPIEVGVYDYSKLTPISSLGVHSSVTQARVAFQIARTAGAANSAPVEFRAAQVSLGAMEELVNRAAPLDLLWPAANEVIRLSQQAATVARQAK
jgi:hypothetical protein